MEGLETSETLSPSSPIRSQKIRSCSLNSRAVVKSTFVKSKTIQDQDYQVRVKNESKEVQVEVKYKSKRFESKSSPNETVKTEKEKNNNLLQNHIAYLTIDHLRDTRDSISSISKIIILHYYF